MRPFMAAMTNLDVFYTITIVPGETTQYVRETNWYYNETDCRYHHYKKLYA